MKNKLWGALALIFLTGCFSREPKYWQTLSVNDVIDSHDLIGNGSRLELAVQDNGTEIIVTSRAVPLCRAAEIGRKVADESGTRQPVSWPLGLLGVGVAGGGGYFGVIGFKGIRDESVKGKDEYLAVGKMAGGSIAFALGTLLFAHCGVGTCGDGRIERRDWDKGTFRRWEDGSQLQPCPDTAKRRVKALVTVAAKFPSSSRQLKWSDYTDRSGRLAKALSRDIHGAASICGWAELTVTSQEGKRHPNDSAEYPSQAMEPAEPAQLIISAIQRKNPALIVDEDIRQVALECADKSRSSCLGERAQELRQNCLIECNSQAGAGYCQFKRDVDLSLDGLNDEDRRLIFESYVVCATKHGASASKTAPCRDACFSRETEKLCPNGW